MMPTKKKAAAQPAGKADQATATQPTAAPRKRGRPKGIVKATAKKDAAAAAPVKRGPGRPKGSKNKKRAATKAPAAKTATSGRRGRPAGSALERRINSMIRELEALRSEVQQLEQMRVALQNIRV
jgi:hypothetical protein